MASDKKEKTDDKTIIHDRFFVGTGINRFGERLKEAMKKRGITSNVRMGALSDMSDTVIRNYLIGRTYPTLDRLAVLAYVLKCSPEWLLTGHDVVENPAPEIEEITDGVSGVSDELELIIKRLPISLRNSLLDAIIQYGVTGIINSLKGMEAFTEFSLLSESERQQVLRLHNEVKKGASDVSENNELDNSTHKNVGRA